MYSDARSIPQLLGTGKRPNSTKRQLVAAREDHARPSPLDCQIARYKVRDGRVMASCGNGPGRDSAARLEANDIPRTAVNNTVKLFEIVGSKQQRARRARPEAVVTPAEQIIVPNQNSA